MPKIQFIFIQCYHERHQNYFCMLKIYSYSSNVIMDVTKAVPMSFNLAVFYFQNNQQPKCLHEAQKAICVTYHFLLRTYRLLEVVALNVYMHIPTHIIPSDSFSRCSPVCLTLKPFKRSSFCFLTTFYVTYALGSLSN